jgi:hypothetical protein
MDLISETKRLLAGLEELDRVSIEHLKSCVAKINELASQLENRGTLH